MSGIQDSPTKKIPLLRVIGYMGRLALEGAGSAARTFTNLICKH
jgi:hypothetical protein